MKRFFLPTLAALLLLAMALPTTLSFTPDSELWISGTSSLHDWTCTAETVQGSVDLEFAANDITALHGVTVTVPVEGIECKNGTMNKKTYKALLSDDHPTITFNLATASLAEGSVEATGMLTIAGVTKQLTFTAQVESLADGLFRFSGEVPLLMTDFGIDPPKALMGTLKTGDAITIGFHIEASR